MLQSLTTITARDSLCDRPLHYCQFGPDGTPGQASYELGPDAIDIPSSVHAAYGVVAHPQMPDGIYQRIQHRLQLNFGAAGYFYCLDARGRDVWISVSLYPTSAGIMACHFRVVSPKLASLVTFYEHLKAEEIKSAELAEREATDADTAAAQVLALLIKQGLTGYREMAGAVMMDEITQRYEGTRRKQFRELKSLDRMYQTLRVIDDLGRNVGTVSERSKLIPYQLKLQAARLESGKGPVGVIASNHQELTASLLKITQDIHMASCNEIDRVIDAMAYLAQANHAVELISGGQTLSEQTPLRADVIAGLKEIIDDCALKVNDVLANIDKSAGALTAISKRMRRALSAMEMTRLMCKVERANIEGPTEGLQDIIVQLQQVEDTLYEVMIKIDVAAQTALNLVKKMSRSAGRHAA